MLISYAHNYHAVFALVCVFFSLRICAASSVRYVVSVNNVLSLLVIQVCLKFVRVNDGWVAHGLLLPSI